MPRPLSTCHQFTERPPERSGGPDEGTQKPKSTPDLNGEKSGVCAVKVVTRVMWMKITRRSADISCSEFGNWVIQEFFPDGKHMCYRKHRQNQIEVNLHGLFRVPEMFSSSKGSDHKGMSSLCSGRLIQQSQ